MVLSQKNKSSDVRKEVAYGDFVWRGLPCRTEPAGLYKYSPFGEVTIRNGGRSGRQNRFLLTFGEVVKSRESSGDSIARRYYVKDYLGNVRAVVDDNGRLMQATDYLAFGLPVTTLSQPPVDNRHYEGNEFQNFRGLGWSDNPERGQVSIVRYTDGSAAKVIVR